MDKSPAGRLLDIALFAPLGLAISVGEALPELTRKGRARLEPQFGVARTVGQMAVGECKRQLTGLPGLLGFGRPRRAPDGPSSSAGRAEETTPGARRPVGNGPVPGPGGRVPSTAPGRGSPPGTARVVAPSRKANGAGDPRRRGGTGSPTGPSGLAIPSYDSLSATQVVQRLDGLSRDEVRAVRAYEAGTRARRTILARADQLLA
jgi:hypothetical protein